MNDLMRADLLSLRPELWLVGGIVAALLADLVTRGRRRELSGVLCLLAAVGACWAAWPGLAVRVTDAEAAAPTRVLGLLSHDGLADFFRLLVISATGVVILHALVFRGLDEESRPEFFPMLLAAALGGCLLVSTDNLLMLVLGMEMLSLPSYLLAGWQKRERRSSEAALKYLVYGALASALMVFGISLFYGLSGSLWMSDVAQGLADAWMTHGLAQRTTVVFSAVLVMAGVGFKIAAFPFHFWAPDVYEGSPTPVTTLLAVASKAAGFGLLVRVVGGVFLSTRPAFNADWGHRFSTLIAVLSAVTMTYGNVTAVLQRNVKRLLAYSSISHAGYLLMGVAVMTHWDSEAGAFTWTAGLQPLLFYLVTYYLATLGAFACVMALANRYGAEDTDDYNGLGWSSPWIAGALVFFLASLTGLPPTAGFMGKWMLFQATLDGGLGWLAVVAALNSVVALFYYFKLARALLLRGEGAKEPGVVARGVLPALAAASIAVLFAATLWFGVGGSGMNSRVGDGVDSLLNWATAAGN
jgi:NADH-quinone oxidoreductase subunit N